MTNNRLTLKTECCQLPVVQWTQNNIDHPPGNDNSLGDPDRTEDNVVNQRELSFRKKLIGR